jgi:hypothetical protein
VTLAIERPRTMTVPILYPCPVGTPWCNDEAAASDENHGTCWSGELYLPATGGRLPDGRLCGATRVSALIAQDRGKEPTINLNVAYDGKKSFVGFDDAEMTLDEAEQLGLFLLDWVSKLRGGGSR